MRTGGILSRNPKHLSSFLRKHAINVDESRLSFVMQRRGSVASRKKHGESMHMLLEEAGCHIDFSLAKSLDDLLRKS